MDKLLQTLAASELGNANELNVPNIQADPTRLNIILNTMFLIAGALAVIFMIVGGVQYIASAGDPESTAKARNTLLYSALGLVISILAVAIVSFVSGRFAL